MSNKNLIVVVGPTAVGKTSFCVQLARHFQTEIVYADSRQMYKEMAIGTAKPTTEEKEGIPHHFVDNLSVTESYNVGRYETEALSCLEQLFQKSDTVILSGGSGLYVKAICEGVDDIPKDETIKQNLIAAYEKEGLNPLLEELKRKDEAYYNQVDRANPHRVLRALEVIRVTGLPYSNFRTGTAKERDFNIIKVGLTRDREELYERIDKRMDLMLEEGLVEEVKSLLPFKNLNSLNTVGYKEIFEFWDGKYDWEEAVRLLKRNSRRYAKRQMTWFRKDSAIQWFHPNHWEEIVQYIQSRLPK